MSRVGQDDGDKVYFAALPPRSICDHELSGLDLRVLACIAIHDRMSGPREQGAGCYVGNLALAEEIGCDSTNLSKSITKLVELDYITRERHPTYKRSIVLRVKYDEADIAFVMGGKNRRDSWSSRQVSVGHMTNQKGESVGHQNPQAHESSKEPSDNIFSETVDKKYSEAKNSRRNDSPARDRGQGESSFQREMREVEKLIAEGKYE